MKPFSSHATQIQILKSRGLIFKDENLVGNRDKLIAAMASLIKNNTNE